MTEPYTLADTWRGWIVENLLRGVERPDLIADLVDAGVPEALADKEIRALEASPALAGCRAVARRARQLELYASLRRDLGQGATIERARYSAERLWRHYETNTPVVFTDATEGWPALERWSLDQLQARFSAATVSVVTGRSEDPRADRNFEAHVTEMTFGAYIDAVRDAPETNDIYMVARNKNIERGALASLWEDVVLDRAVFEHDEAAPCMASLWIGPAGTVTPLHHDPCNILFNQIEGRKRVHLVPPWEPGVLSSLEGFYSALDCEDRERWEVEATVHTLDLQPGESLFIPVGWFHQLRALDVSVSFSLLSFTRPNNFEWYQPGSIAG